MFEIIEENAQLDSSVKIGNHTIIKSGAQIGKNTIIGDFCYIDSNVVIGENNHIGTGVYIKGKTNIGNNNYILDQTIIGLPSKHIGYHHYQGRVIIGHDNFISNNCAIDAGNNHLSDKHPELLFYMNIDLPQEENFEDATIISNRCYILNGVSVHHNCRIGLGNIPNSKDEYDTVICAGCCLNGFVQVHKGCELSSGTYVREFAAIGEGAFTAMLSHITKDVPPFTFIRNNKNCGDFERLQKKFNVSSEQIEDLRRSFQNHTSKQLKSY